MPQLINEQAARSPDRTAVVFEGEYLTYAQLNARATALAVQLLALGVGPDTPVGVCMERSLEMVVALLAVLRAGGAYVPVDPSYPSDRVTYMLSHSGAGVVLSQPELVDRLSSTGAQVLTVDPVASAGPERSALVERPFDPGSLAYIIYTSGSTGLPKGVQIPHRALTNFLTTMAERPGLGGHDVLVAVTTLSFDIAGLELWLPLINGARVVLASRAVAGDPRRLARLLAESGATVMQATPTTWQMLVADGWQGQPGLRALCGGEPLPVALADALLARGLELWNMYGPTETTIWSTIDRVVAANDITIGGPIANTTLYVLDEQLRTVPVGTPGELHIGGDGLARGYRDRDDLTAERFIPHPFDPTPGTRLYKTGDLARWRPDGRIEHLGRLDHQVKIRGFRIELGEVETVLDGHPTVAASVVVAREDTPGDKRLVAYVIAAPGTTPANAELRHHLAAKLPSYMVPAAFVTLDSFPLTPNGKIDRKVLPAPESVAGMAMGPAVEPRTELETQLAAIWEDVLGIFPIGVTTDFLDLGISSITAARLMARVERDLGADLPLGAMFQAPTIEKLAAVIEGDVAPTRWSSLVAIQPDGGNRPFFCVHGGAGTILHLRPLARRLGEDQPFYGLTMRGLYGTEPPQLWIPEMAAHYLGEIRTVQPEGPYLLGGYCFGAIVAYEMAQQLRRAGEETALLVMFNGAAPAYLRPRPGPISRRPIESGPEPSWPARQTVKLKKAVRRAQLRGLVAAGRPLPERLRDTTFIRICYRAERRYRPERYPGRIVQFRAAGLFDEPTIGWAGLPAGGIEDYEVPGEHLDQREAMREPFVGWVAERLAECIAEATRPKTRLRAEG